MIDPTNGRFTWTPPLSQGPATNLVTVRVTDNGIPNLSDTRSFNVVVVPPPMIESIVPTGESVAITWSAIAGRTYRVQFKSDLGESDWNDLAGDVTSNGSTASKTDTTISGPQRSYRVVLLP